MGAPADRRAELEAGWRALADRVRAACVAASRDPASVSVIAVTKTYPASDVRLLASLGVTDVGENRDQEAGPKHEACADLSLRWHFIGHLQRNKAGSVARYADIVHSVDRAELATALSTAAVRHERQIGALVQVSLDPASASEPGAAAGGRSGAAPDEVDALADHVATLPGLVLRGVMAVAPLGGDADEAFAVLQGVADRLRSRHPAADMVSAGMSGDLEAAVRHGATHLRVGTALLGPRSTLVR